MTIEFPAKLRVHALAKLLGITSKEARAHLAELGVEVASAHSSVVREMAEAVAARLTGDAPTEPQTASVPEPAPVADVVPEPAAQADVPTAAEQTEIAPTAAVPTEAADGEQAAAEAQPTSRPTRTRSRRAVRSGRAARPEASTDTEPAQADDAAPADKAVPAGKTAPAEQIPSLFSAVEKVVATPAAPVAAPVGPLFLSPEPVAADAVKSSDTPDSADATPTEPESRQDEAPQDDAQPADAPQAEPQPAERQSTERQELGNRRRRRGRRGRGRGRADEQGDTGVDAGRQAAGEQPDTAAPAAEAPAVQPGDAEQTADDRSAEAGDDARGTDDARPKGKKKSKKAHKKPKVAEPEAEAADEPSEEAESVEETDVEAESDDSTAESASRRRRRRRRRRGGVDGEDAPAEDDPPNTVVHERQPRPPVVKRDRDEVQGISGSTRLEAKRQRRRDGRDTARRRPPILTESEFLARRESVDRVMVIRERRGRPAEVDGHGDDAPTVTDYTQVAVLEDGVLVEHFVTTASSTSTVGNIYLGRVQNVLPSMEAAFIDIGRGRNGVLYAGEVNWEAAGLGGGARKIEQALRPGDQVLVQVSKDPIGHKGARLTTQISLAGRFLVYVPNGSSAGISRKLPDVERKRLKQVLGEIVPSDASVIVRTAAEGVSSDALAEDITRLQSQWTSIEAESRKTGGGPRPLYEEPDLLVKVVRDLFNEDFGKLVVEGENAWQTVHGYVKSVAPDLLARVSRYVAPSFDGPDVFAVHRIDEQLTKALDRKVWLPSGGTLIIERTEAMTVVDVNTGKFTGAGGNLEETVTRNNLEAAEEIVRQMRLRDIGGMIIVDFIDMVLEANRDLVLRRLTEALGRDRTRHQVSEVTSLGLVQMTRKRLGTGLLEAFSTTCACCQGRGVIIHTDPVDLGPAGDGKTEGARRPRRRRPETAAPAPEPVVSAPVASVPAGSKPVGQHPLFKAMAAAHDGEGTPVIPTGRDGDTPAGEPGVAAATFADESEVAIVEAERRPARRRRRSRRSADADTQRQDVEANVSTPEPAAEAPVAVDAPAVADAPAVDAPAADEAAPVTEPTASVEESAEQVEQLAEPAAPTEERTAPAGEPTAPAVDSTPAPEPTAPVVEPAAEESGPEPAQQVRTRRRRVRRTAPTGTGTGLVVSIAAEKAEAEKAAADAAAAEDTEVETAAAEAPAAESPAVETPAADTATEAPAADTATEAPAAPAPAAPTVTRRPRRRAAARAAGPAGA